MKGLFLILSLAFFASVSAQDIKLPAPDVKKSSKSMVETLSTRHSVRTYSSQKLSVSELSDLCWAACGVSRDENHRTAPTARNRREIRLYVLLDDAAYEYEAEKNNLRFIAKGDYRNLVAGNDPDENGRQGFAQKFVNEAPVILVMVVDYSRLGGNGARAHDMGCVDAGIVCQNINLYCESVGLVTVPRATMEVTALRKLFSLGDDCLPIMNNPVGYPKN